MKYNNSSIIKPLLIFSSIDLLYNTHILDRYILFTSKFFTSTPFRAALIKCSNETLCVQDMQILMGCWLFLGVMVMACVSQMGK